MLIDPNDIEKLCEILHRAGQKIVFTNGCFDILHAGHVRYLEKARSFGDCLVLGLNTDASVRGNKGPARPINGELDRARGYQGVYAFEPFAPELAQWSEADIEREIEQSIALIQRHCA